MIKVFIFQITRIFRCFGLNQGLMDSAKDRKLTGFKLLAWQQLSIRNAPAHPPVVNQRADFR